MLSFTYRDRKTSKTDVRSTFQERIPKFSCFRRIPALGQPKSTPILFSYLDGNGLRAPRYAIAPQPPVVNVERPDFLSQTSRQLKGRQHAGPFHYRTPLAASPRIPAVFPNRKRFKLPLRTACSILLPKMTLDLIDLRAARPADCEALASIHSEAWLGAYRGVLHGLDLQRMVSRRGENWWRGALARGVNIKILSVADVPAGYATFGPCRLTNTSMDGEIYELYLKPEYQGLGFGRRLFEDIRASFLERHGSGLAVQVLSDNTPAREFYRALGGQVAGKSWHRIGGRRLELLIYIWPRRTL